MATNQNTGKRILASCLVLIEIGLVIVAVLYLIEGNTRDAVSYAGSSVALAVAGGAWWWASARLERSREGRL